MAATTSDQIQTLRTSGCDYIVHFSAKWCGPCQRIQRAVQEMVREHGLRYLYLDLDGQPVTARVNARSMPSVATSHLLDINLEALHFFDPETESALH